ncbi:MAG: hypothetical protein QNJ97_16910 [Myxococcota bacterium]|nr:hypothetical protein [Myxococcota bacterium]
MIPIVYEWHWDMGHFIFMGLLYAVLTVVGVTLSLALMRAHRNRHRAAHILWEESFHDLPPSRVICRYAFSGRAPDKICDHDFDCNTCDFHGLRKTTPDRETSGDKSTRALYGYDLDLDLMYDRGHTWVRQEEDGTLTIGLDDMAERVVGPIDEVILPPVGTELSIHGQGFDIVKGKTHIRVLSPVAGQVIATGSAADGWWLKVRPSADPPALDHLYSGPTAERWSEEELKLVEAHLGLDRSPFIGKKNLPAAFPNTDWPTLWHEFFLNV